MTRRTTRPPVVADAPAGRDPSRWRRARWKIGTRLLVAQTLVLTAAVATAGVIAAAIGPPLFHKHMLEADPSPDPSGLRHMEQAFRAASAISIGVAIAAALVVALVVSWYLTRRFQVPLTSLTQAAEEVSQGHYDARVAVGRAGPELDSLAGAFNTMADQLAQTESTRRRLLSDLAHELRTPVATLNGFLEGLEDGVTEWNSGTRELMADQVQRLTRLAEDIDAVSRAEEGRLQLQYASVAVDDLVNSAAWAHSGAFREKGVSLAVVRAEMGTVEADRERLLQVLTNLLDNARRHTPPGGQVTIGARDLGPEVSISVTDSGEGITPEQLSHVFERFFRGDSARSREQQGSGIGLTISRAIAEAHGGSLCASSGGPGSGATFVLRIPKLARRRP